MSFFSSSSSKHLTLKKCSSINQKKTLDCGFCSPLSVLCTKPFAEEGMRRTVCSGTAQRCPGRTVVKVLSLSQEECSGRSRPELPHWAGRSRHSRQMQSTSAHPNPLVFLLFWRWALLENSTPRGGTDVREAQKLTGDTRINTFEKVSRTSARLELVYLQLTVTVWLWLYDSLLFLSFKWNHFFPPPAGRIIKIMFIIHKLYTENHIYSHNLGFKTSSLIRTFKKLSHYNSTKSRLSLEMFLYRYGLMMFLYSDKSR